MRDAPYYVLASIGADEDPLFRVTFVAVTVALTAGVCWYMRRKTNGAGQTMGASSRSDPGPRGGRVTGTTPGRWIYKTDEEGRPRRFFSHGEAAWWATLRTGMVAGPLLLYAFLQTFLETAGPSIPLAEKLTYFFVPVAAFVSWLLVVGMVYLYLVLSGAVMAADEHRHRGNESGGRA